MTSIFRPGIILVRSRPVAASFSHEDLAQWYLSKHIPDVLATRGVVEAGLHQLNDISRSRLNTAAGLNDEGRFSYLAVYRLWDLNWLHEPDCEFWKLPLVLGTEAGINAGRSVFELAEFDTSLWELFSRPPVTGGVYQLLGECNAIGVCCG
ncbi:uncharacterized protein C8A04DRAFT_14847 [Dichotomopilus funicola]|uniref:EthD domain-containing protein n=1 Tax=Dichotomopilus funicola TaxID=1934379 RepID=A0AAN6ZK61_9PEZI|nr:hypothetical protein C8A04DRAFT_14847 [Dichotomopilus funicola]